MALAAFVLGAAAGVALPRLAPAIVPFGTLWVRALGAVVVPLVVALLITGVAAVADARTVGRLGAAAVGVFLTLLAGGSALVAVSTPWILTLLGVQPVGASALRSQLAGAGAAAAPAAGTPPPLPGAWRFIATLIPENPVAAAAGGALLPLVVFTVTFAIALGRLPAGRREAVVEFARTVGDAMLLVVRWLLWLAPLGVFALAFGLGARGTGVGAGAGAGAIVGFVALVAVACLVFLVLLYALAGSVGGLPLVHFARAIAPAQVVALGSRSSLASLPAMIEASDGALALPPAISGFLLPLAVATFKLGATIAVLTGSLFLARLYGVAVSPAQLASLAVTAALLSFAVPGVPGGVLLVMVPVLTGLGIPAEGVALLVAVDVVPDMIRTLTNVTADLTAAVVVARVVDGDAGAAGGDGDRAGDPLHTPPAPPTGVAGTASAD